MMRHPLKALGLGLLLTCSLARSGEIVRECGVYAVEGYYLRTKTNERVMLLDRGSQSEVRVRLTNDATSFREPAEGANANYAANLLFTAKCAYDCRAKAVSELKALRPGTTPKSFGYPRPKPLKGIQACDG